MNDLHEKKGHDIDGAEKAENNPHEDMQLFYKKLCAHLLLLYQAYLKKETLLEPEIKAAIWRMIQLQEGFPIKIRMMQLDYLSYETDTIDGPWDAVKDSLFPIKDHELLDSLAGERESQLQEYRDVIFELLGNSV